MSGISHVLRSLESVESLELSMRLNTQCGLRHVAETYVKVKRTVRSGKEMSAILTIHLILPVVIDEGIGIMRLKVVAAVAALTLTVGSGIAAAAVIPPGINGPGLAAVGPVSSTDGFPVWYKDNTGLRLEACLAPLNDPMCPVRDALPDETLPISFPSNYPGEAFYTISEASMTTRTGKALGAVQLEQAFASDAPIAGDQVTFARVRYIIDAAPNASYKITSPAGEKTLVAPADGQIKDTEDIGISERGDFSGALGGRIGPFLTWDTYPTDPALKLNSLGMATYVGDPNTLHKIKGSPYDTNFFRIEGLNINPSTTVDACPTIAGPIGDCLETDLFAVQGKLATTAGVVAEQATYSRSSTTGGFVDVFASSEPDGQQSIQVTDIPDLSGFSTTGLAGSAGNYFAHAAFTGAQPPAQVQVSNIGDVPVSNKVINVVDRLSGTAVYTTGTVPGTPGTLTINAVSSDTGVARTLTAGAYGVLVGGSLTVTPLDAPPVSVTVTSDVGGSVKLAVEVAGTAAAPVSVVAMAGPNQTVSSGQLVTLDGTASSGDVATMAWTSPAGVALSDPNIARPTFTAPAVVGDYTFTLTVNGPGGPSSATVMVTVLAATPAVANAGVDQTGVQRGTKVTLDGTLSSPAAGYLWTQVLAPGDPTAVLAGANTATPTFIFPFYQSPANTGLLTFNVLVTSADGSTATDQVTVSPSSDALVVASARYRNRELRVSGISSIRAGQTVTVHLGSLTGPVVGTDVVGALGDFSVRRSYSSFQSGQRVFVESQLGGTVVNFSVRIG
jgi:hypothetical protein